jgi:hypothetical protein
VRSFDFGWHILVPTVCTKNQSLAAPKNFEGFAPEIALY